MTIKELKKHCLIVINSFASEKRKAEHKIALELIEYYEKCELEKRFFKRLRNHKDLKEGNIND